MKADRIEDALAALVQGSMVVVVDDEDRENEGDLTLAAEKVSPEAINFMARDFCSARPKPDFFRA